MGKEHPSCNGPYWEKVMAVQQVEQDEVLVTVVVPVYNVERTLARCLDSILAQTHSNIEIILVNDQSPDGSKEIALKYAQKNKRVQYVEREINGGLAAARNMGMDNAGGEYIMFVDSDDYLHPEMCQKLLAQITESKADIVQCGMHMIRDGELGSLAQSKPKATNRFGNDGILLTSKRDILKSIDIDAISKVGLIAPSACNKIYSRKLLFDSGVRFDESLRFAEDLLFQMQLVEHMSKVQLMTEKLYYYDVSPDLHSLTRGITLATLYDNYSSWLHVASIIKELDTYLTFKRHYNQILRVSFIYVSRVQISTSVGEGQEEQAMWLEKINTLLGSHEELISEFVFDYKKLLRYATFSGGMPASRINNYLWRMYMVNIGELLTKLIRRLRINLK